MRVVRFGNMFWGQVQKLPKAVNIAGCCRVFRNITYLSLLVAHYSLCISSIMIVVLVAIVVFPPMVVLVHRAATWLLSVCAASVTKVAVLLLPLL